MLLDINLSQVELQINTELCTLRTLQPKDVSQDYVSGLNDLEVNHFLDSVSQNIQTLESVRDFVNSSFAAKNEIFFGIWNDSLNEHCGTIRIHSINSYHKTANIGVCLFDKNIWGKGIATNAILQATDWAINVLGLKWIEAGVFEENRASSKLFERAGYELKYKVSGKYLSHGSASTVKVYAFNIPH